MKKSLLYPLIVGVLLLSACGSSKSAESYAYGADTAKALAVSEESYAANDIYRAAGEVEMEMADEPQQEGKVESAAEVSDLSARKLIRDANMTAETENFDHLLTVVEEKVKNLGGYMENYSTSKNSAYYGGNENRYASLTIRIPAVNYDKFLSEVAEVSNVLNRNESVRDVTLQYVDLESHKKVLQVEQARLLELLEKAESIEDIIAIESRLSDVRYQIESMESQLRTYDNLVDYSTIYLYINEVKQLTPVQEQTLWEKISTGFVKSLKNVGSGLVDFFVWFIIAIPYFAVLAVIAVVIVLIIRTRTKKNKNENRKKKEDESA